jgi:hypothetical protein
LVLGSVRINYLLVGGTEAVALTVHLQGQRRVTNSLTGLAMAVGGSEHAGRSLMDLNLMSHISRGLAIGESRHGCWAGV